MKIGVQLSLDRDAGELFADARALETAGVDSLWDFGAGAQSYVLLGALAAATSRVRLVSYAADASQEDDADDRARATCAALARGRLVIAAESFVVVRGGPDEVGAKFGQEPAEIERWVVAALPIGQPAWRDLRAAYEAAGATGIVVPNDPRLLDMLRNPDVNEDRQDVKLAFG